MRRVSLRSVFSARVPLGRAFEHCNINDTEIESSRYLAEGSGLARSPSALQRKGREGEGPSGRTRGGDVEAQPLGNIHFRERLESSLPSGIVRNLFFRAPPGPFLAAVGLCTDDTEIDAAGAAIPKGYTPL